MALYLIGTFWILNYKFIPLFCVSYGANHRNAFDHDYRFCVVTAYTETLMLLHAFADKTVLYFLVDFNIVIQIIPSIL